MNNSSDDPDEGDYKSEITIENSSDKWGWITFVAIMIVFVIVIIVVVIIFTMSDIVTEYDTTKIPFQYQLSLRNLYAINDRYDYVISSLPDHEFNQESNLTALQEDRYLPNGTMHRVITATAFYTNIFYVAWGPPITIKFVTSNQTTSDDLISCDYQFVWTVIVNGYVNRKCENESDFRTISYVKGSSLFGFAFYSLDEKEVYAYTTIPDLAVWDYFR
ncbi:23698_t:CDS:2, partial [Dentiscutata erythropus]